MSYRQILKFYFFADELNAVLDEVILRFAKSSADCFKGCAYYAEKIGEVIAAKSELGELWAFLDLAIGSMTEGDKCALYAYAIGCTRTGGLSEEGARAEHRAIMKLSRRVKDKLGRYARQVNVLREYYCFVKAAGK